MLLLWHDGPDHDLELFESRFRLMNNVGSGSSKSTVGNAIGGTEQR